MAPRVRNMLCRLLGGQDSAINELAGLHGDNCRIVRTSLDLLMRRKAVRTENSADQKVPTKIVAAFADYRARAITEETGARWAGAGGRRHHRRCRSGRILWKAHV